MLLDTLPKPKPFWHRLNAFFAFPIQPLPLMYGVVLALCSLLFEALFFVPDVLAFLIVEFGIMLAASRYGFKIIALASRGIVRARDFPSQLDDEWVSLPWKLFAVLVAQGMFAGWLAWLSPVFGTIALFVICFIFPATVLVLVQSGSAIQALHPGFIWGAVRIIGWPYAVLCFFLFLLSSGAEIAMALLLPLIGGWLALPIFNFALIYFSWVMASLLGYVMYQHHAAFDIDLLHTGSVDNAAPERRTPEQIAQQQTDTLVAQMVTDGDVSGALGLAYDAQRTRLDDVAAQRRYHQVLLLSDQTAQLLDHAQRHIALLMRRQLTSEALKVYQACRDKDAKFAVDDAVHTLALARAGWRNGDGRAALALLAGFDKRFRGHASIPQVYELAARVLVQGLHRPDMARPILATLQARYPDSEQTQEVRWLLRDLPAA
jgi:hypothetical protein